MSIVLNSIGLTLLESSPILSKATKKMSPPGYSWNPSFNWKIELVLSRPKVRSQDENVLTFSIGNGLLVSIVHTEVMELFADYIKAHQILDVIHGIKNLI